MRCLKLCSLCVLVVLSNAMGVLKTFVLSLFCLFLYLSLFHFRIFFYLLFVGWELLEIIYLNINPFAFLI